MSEARHVIRRQVIELKMRRSAEAHLYQEELSRIYRQRVVPLIEQRCSELGKPGRLYRLDSLELDLGRLDPGNLEQDFTEKVDAVLSRELARQIETLDEAARQRGDRPEMGSQLELFGFFACNGSLPWWAEASHPGLLAENLEQLLREAPEALGRLLVELLREPEPRRRIVNNYGDRQLAALGGLLVPAYEEMLESDLQQLLQALQSLQAVSIELKVRFRQRWWEDFLMVAATAGGQYGSLEALYRAVLKRVIPALGEPGNQVAAGIQREIQEGRIRPGDRLSEVIAALAGADANLSGPIVDRLRRRLAQLQAGVPAQHARTAGDAELQRVMEMLRQTAGEIEPCDQGAIQQLLSKPAREEWPEEKGKLDLSFSEADELFVSNAGLVILWPFLVHFFGRLELLDEKRRLRDLTSSHRAAGLLQVVAAGEASFPEYLLPLNKVLCGIQLQDVFDFGPPLLEVEATACTRLLEALIAQVPVLHNMSVDGFRGTFLLRPGLLSTLDGTWLLRVERQTYDIVLEQFPWSWEWIKLPWMEAPLRVDW